MIDSAVTLTPLNHMNNIYGFHSSVGKGHADYIIDQEIHNVFVSVRYHLLKHAEDLERYYQESEDYQESADCQGSVGQESGDFRDKPRHPLVIFPTISRTFVEAFGLELSRGRKPPADLWGIPLKIAISVTCWEAPHNENFPRIKNLDEVRKYLKLAEVSNKSEV